jgi:hypothetical protein
MNQGVKVNGAWNNAEGNQPNFKNGWGDALERLGTDLNYSSNRVNADTGRGCKECRFGKTDWTVGKHALWNWLQCWTMYAPLPYNLTDNMTIGGHSAGGGGWSEQPMAGGPDGGPFADGGECRTEGQILPPQHNQTHREDWASATANTAWLRDKTEAGAAMAQPFYLYQVSNRCRLALLPLSGEQASTV